MAEILAATVHYHCTNPESAIFQYWKKAADAGELDGLFDEPTQETEPMSDKILSPEERLMLYGHASEREIRNALYKQAAADLYDVERIREQIMFDVDSALQEVKLDQLLVEIPDTTRSFEELVTSSDVNDASDPRGHQEVLRLEPVTFRPTLTESGQECATPPASTRAGAARALARALFQYLLVVRDQQPAPAPGLACFHKPYEYRLFICWGTRPEIRESKNPLIPGFVGYARFVAQWAHKKFAPAKPVDELSVAALDALKTQIDVIEKNRRDNMALSGIKEFMRKPPPAQAEFTPDDIISMRVRGEQIALALPPRLHLDGAWVIDVPSDPADAGPLLFITTKEGANLFARKPAFGDTWFALVANKNVMALWWDHVKADTRAAKRGWVEPQPVDDRPGLALAGALRTEREIDDRRGDYFELKSSPAPHMIAPESPTNHANTQRIARRVNRTR